MPNENGTVSERYVYAPLDVVLIFALDEATSAALSAIQWSARFAGNTMPMG